MLAYSLYSNELIEAGESKEIIDFDIDRPTFYLAIDQKIFEGVTDGSKLHQSIQHPSASLGGPVKAVEVQQKQKYSLKF